MPAGLARLRSRAGHRDRPAGRRIGERLRLDEIDRGFDHLAEDSALRQMIVF